MTSRIVWVNRGIRTHLEASGKGFIYAFWHGRQVFLTYLHQGDRVRPLVSQSRDGELISQVCLAFGLVTIRGSSSKGGVTALMEMTDAIRAGERPTITPDGPRGPFHEVQSGVLYLAQKCQCPIVPVAFGARRKWIFGRWDRYHVPKPFNRIAMAYGQPLWVKPNDDLSQRAQELKMALNAITQQADQAAGAPHEE